jgi:acetyl esterase
MPLDPQAKAILDASPDMPDFDTMDVATVRATMTEGDTLSPGDVVPVARVENRSIPGPDGEIPVRIYWPEGSGPFPIIVFFHGGGWVICDLDTHDGQARSLCKGVGAVVLSVDYRLAPEHPFPAGPEDCYAATLWASEHAAEIDGDASRIAVAGDSAGGNLSAVVALMARDRGAPALCFQLLVYPVTDHNFETRSYVDNATGYFLTTSSMRWFWRQYLKDPADARNPYASPMRAEELSGLPPALCITAEYDPLRDEGEAYAQRLRDAGVAVTTSRYDGVIHGFFGMGALIDRANDAVDEACSALRAALTR